MTQKHLRVIFITDSESLTAQFVEAMETGGLEPAYRQVCTATELTEALAEGGWDIIICECSLRRFSARAALEMVSDRSLDIPFIVVLESLEGGLAVEAMNAGARDFLLKNETSRLVPAIEREIRDAGERKARRNLQAAIRRGKMEWEAAFDAGSDLIIMTDLSGRIIRCNRRVITYFGCDYRDVLGKQAAALFCGSSTPDPQVFPLFPGRTDGKGDEDVTFPGLVGWFTVTSYPMHFEGKPYGMVHIVKDITSRRRAEEEKKLSERELLTLYAVAFRLNAAQGFSKVMKGLLTQLHTMLSIEFSAIYLRERGVPRLKSSLGFSRNFTAAVRTLPGDLPLLGEVSAGRQCQGADLSDELPPQAAAAARTMGIRAWCALPLKAGDEIIGMMLVAQRTEHQYASREVFLFQTIANQLAVLMENHSLYQKMQEKTRELQKNREQLQANLQELRRANSELGRLNATKNMFIGMASHELKTPITSILGGVDFLFNYSGIAMTEEQRGIFASVHEGVIQLTGLVDDLLSFSRIETGGTIQKKPLDLLELSRTTRDTFSLPLSNRNITVTVAGEDLPVPVEAGLCRRVIRNLLENAIKFTPDNGSISVTGRRVERDEVLSWMPELSPFYQDCLSLLGDGRSFYRFDVVDTGIGIPPEERQRVFEKFYGIGNIAYHSSGKTDFMAKGTGLGLAIVRGIMDGHNGLVWNAAGPDGVGTVFSLLFPLE